MKPVRQPRLTTPPCTEHAGTMKKAVGTPVDLLGLRTILLFARDTPQHKGNI